MPSTKIKTSTEGLYGSSIGKNIFTALAAEGFATYLFLVGGLTSVVALVLYGTETDAFTSSLVVSAAFATSLLAVAATFGHVCGAHCNPAVTLGLVVRGAFPTKLLLPYWLVQLLGAWLAALTVRYMFGPAAKSQALLGSPSLGEGVGILSGFLTELVITTLLVIVIVSVASDARAQGSPAIPVGAALFVAVFVGFHLTGGSANAARALGPLIEAEALTANIREIILVYVSANLLGGSLAGAMYRFFSRGQDPSEVE
jgi:glycerol uptake facilitator-like aquaporin